MTTVISEDELERQQPYKEQVFQFYAELKHNVQPMACVRTFGCQQNVSDSEHIKGMLAEMGFAFTEEPEEADLILFNTCAVREHASDRVFGNVGALKHIKARHPHVLIAVCGCMVQQPHVAEKFKESYPFVGLVFGTHVIHRLPELLWEALHSGRQLSVTPQQDGVIAEGIRTHRDGTFKAWLPIMYGCNNFCTYCVVPYVRGRERSRKPEDILAEAKELIAAGYKEITLLGQNVNSYGKGESHGVTFAGLLRQINDLEGDFTIRFMTSHPKDATHELFDTIAACKKISHHFHLPFQSGNDRVLRAMNRHYDRAQYLELVRYARSVVPDISFTSDVIVGFPGETREEFEDTLSLVKEVSFTSLFTFIYSPRVGTPAASLPDPVPPETKVAWLQELNKLQESISGERLAKLVGTRQRALLESVGNGYLEARLPDNGVVRVNGEEGWIGRYAEIEIEDARSWVMHGHICHVE